MSAAAPARPQADAPVPLAGPALLIAGVCLALANFMVVLDTTIVNVSVPHIAGGLAVSPSEGTWAITSYSVAEAIAKNPFMVIVPCHRVLEAGHYADKISPFGGTISKRHLLSLEGTHPIASKTLFDVLLPVAPPRPHN